MCISVFRRLTIVNIFVNTFWQISNPSLKVNRLIDSAVMNLTLDVRITIVAGDSLTRFQHFIYYPWSLYYKR